LLYCYSDLAENCLSSSEDRFEAFARTGPRTRRTLVVRELGRSCKAGGSCFIAILARASTSNQETDSMRALLPRPESTGKNIAAEFPAACFSRDLQHRGLHVLVSKNIGEREKNLGSVIDRGNALGAVLFFDKADAPFSQRAEVWSACDRCADGQPET
jgi:hypothetical protein